MDREPSAPENLPDRSHRDRERLGRVLAWVALLVCYAAIYLPALGHEFVWDDRPAIVANPIFHGPIRGGLVATQMDHISKELNQLSELKMAHDSYRPLLYLSHRLDIELFGFDARAMHASSILAGLAAAVGLFFFAKLWLLSWWQAFFVTAFYALHPAQVEAITFISARGDVLASLFIFLASAAALRQQNEVGRKRIAWTVAALVSFLASLLSKESVVGWPVALMLLFWSKGELHRQWRVLGSIVALLAVYLVVRFTVFGTATGASLSESIVALPGIWLEALRIGVFPMDLSTERLRDAAYVPYGWGAVAVLTTMGAVAMRRPSDALFHSLRMIFAGLAWMFLLMGPAALVIVLHGTLPDRYLFPPLSGLALALVITFASLLRIRPAIGKIAIGVGAILAAMGIVISAIQVGFWKNNMSLYSRAVEMAPNSSMAFYRLGYAFASEKQFAKAVPLFEHALKLDPHNDRARNNLGVSLLTLGDLPRAKIIFTQIVAQDPTYYRAWYNLGLVEIRLGNKVSGCRALDRALSNNSIYPAARKLRADACTDLANPNP